ncbi:tripartite tricarboxylate transporter permease [Brevibacterium album]|uniref:tripartite tricarboxylate transporter permease n=1 Tax=Brevibacterium album TaxID=417948 RepID=UPI0004248CE0|nr:tripartite tricarboxylate transporter permease [Brevibacterium album]
MEVINGLTEGFSTALTPANLLYVTLGVLIGTVVGLLPGLGSTATIALLLPLTYHLEPASAIIMLAGIYYGGMYGGRIPSILLRLPGDSSAVITTLDGYPLAKQGRAGAALTITAIGSFVGGTIAIVLMTLLAPGLARFAGRIGPPEIFLLALIGLFLIAFMGSGSRWKALLMGAFGLILATIGIDAVSATPRVTFGFPELDAGINIVALAVGLFGIGEVLNSMYERHAVSLENSRIGRLWPTRDDVRRSIGAIIRASGIGFIIGVLPGGGGAVSSIVAYGAEKNFSKNPEKFGKGAIDGLAATETADNASSNAAFIPLLTLGIPPNPVIALIFGALLLQNITPGPQLVNSHPEVFWGVIASMYIGNLLLVLFNIPLIGVFVQLLRVRQTILNAIIIVVALIGVFSSQNRLFDVGVAVVFGIVGFVLKRMDFELGPLILGFILGPILEVQFRRAMLMSGGSFDLFLTRPFSLSLLIVFAGAGVAMWLFAKRSRATAVIER